jgi:uncharacterized protein YuzE
VRETRNFSGFTGSHWVVDGSRDMKKVSYSQDVDALLIELSEQPIAYAEADGNVILHYSEADQLVLVEILEFRRLMSDTAAELLTV